ncbi:septum site-determining protein Ssd [Williamsia sp. CHRR-6]|uniref:septum site-determining protein Ssd n=1 Tax=Williamsia sp. CHRR-6 TaxID=2835871 RepID=UPI001BDAD31C|nr:septum site-determining protein Ssd [Williamsia sp. CHRR-6]MBT0567136.1 hypothetical protein [Williamsia sp. CHRR-6]
MNDLLLSVVGDDLTDDVARCAAAAGYQLIAATAENARRAWTDARAVVIDAAIAAQVVELGWPRRDAVLVVAGGTMDPVVWRSAVTLGAVDGYVLPADEHDVVAALTRLRAPRRRAGAAIACIGGHGGAGASLLSAAIGLRGAAELGRTVLLLDADPLGGGLDLVLGAEETPGLRWSDLTLERGRVFADSLHAALPYAARDLAVLAPRRGDRRPVGVETVLGVLDAGRTAGDLVVIDLPRGADDVVTAVAEAVDLLVVLSCATVTGCASSRELVTALRRSTDRLELVVRGPSPGGLRPSAMARTIGIDLLTTMRPQRGIPEQVENGRLQVTARSQLGRAADLVIDRAVAASGMAA